MKIQKLVAFGIAGAALMLSGASEAANPNITSLSQVPSQVATDIDFIFKVNGTGYCALKYEIVDSTGAVTSSGTFSGFGYQLPASSHLVKAQKPGVNKLVVTTIANQNTPNCVVGQKLETTFNVFQQPKCPQGWDRVQFDGFTGAISCVVKKPTLTCNGKSEDFYSPTWPTQCQAGCYTPAY
jgi:hypothetical protein